jgi:hypothetical protein
MANKKEQKDLQSITHKTIQIIVTRETLRVPLVEQELPTLPEHLISPRFLKGLV